MKTLLLAGNLTYASLLLHLAFVGYCQIVNPGCKVVGQINNWTREEVLDSLQSLVESPTFASSGQLRAFISYVVTKKLDGEEDSLKAYTIAVDALGKPESFDPQIDPSVRILAGKLRNALKVYYAAGDTDEPLKFDIPKGSYRPEFLANTKTVQDLPAENSDLPKSHSEYWWTIPTMIGLISIVVAVTLRILLIEDKSQDHEPHAPIVAIAVFENVSDKPGINSFNSTFRFDLVSELSRFSWLSTYVEKDNQESFHSDYILRGSITTQNHRVRVSYRLESTDTGIVQWAQVFDRKFTSESLFHIQQESVRAIATAIGNPGGILNQLEQDRYQQKVGGLNAYLCTLKLYDYWKTHSPKDHLVLRNCLEEAKITDSDYAEARAALAFVYLDEEMLGFNKRSGYDPFKRALTDANKAVSLDPFSTLAKRALYSANLVNGNIAEFIRIGKKAIELNPNDPELLADFGNKLAIGVGVWEEGIHYSKKALRLNPSAPPSYFLGLALRAITNKQYDEVISWTDRMSAKDWPLCNIARAIAFSQLKNLPATQTSFNAMNTKSVERLKNDIQGYRMHHVLEALLIKEIATAFNYVNNTQ